MVMGLGAGLSRSQSTIVTRSTYGSSVTTVNTPDYLAQERWMAASDQLARAGRERMQAVDDTYLKKTTVFPDTQFMGLLWFSRQKTFQSGLLSVSIGERNYEFPFPPPETAKAPTAPGIPTAGTVASATFQFPLVQSIKNRGRWGHHETERMRSALSVPHSSRAASRLWTSIQMGARH
jgi:hypothetical protein